MKEDCNEELPDMNSPPDEKAGYPGVLKLDAEKYLPYVEEFDITDTQKIELLRTLWNIMSAFVDLGWDVDFVPEFLPGLREIYGEFDGAVLGKDSNSMIEKFNGAATLKEGDNDNEED